MQREALRDRLTADRSMLAHVETAPGKNRADSVLPGLRDGYIQGKKLKEAASYLASARAALLHWTRDTCLSSDNLDTHAEHLEETLRICGTLKDLQGTIEFKARLYGEML